MLERLLCRANGSRAPLHLETLPCIFKLSTIEFEDHEVFFYHVLDQHILIVRSKGDTLRPMTDGCFSELGELLRLHTVYEHFALVIVEWRVFWFVTAVH